MKLPARPTARLANEEKASVQQAAVLVGSWVSSTFSCLIKLKVCVNHNATDIITRPHSNSPPTLTGAGHQRTVSTNTGCNQ